MTTATARGLLDYCYTVGIDLRPNGDLLHVRAPQPVPDRIRAALRERKAELLRLLTTPDPSLPPDSVCPFATDHAGQVAPPDHGAPDGACPVCWSRRGRAIPLHRREVAA